MAKLTAYNVRIKVYCADDRQARAVQDAVSGITDGIDLVGEDIVGFHAYYRKNEGIIRPVLTDVLRNGLGAIGKHVLTLRKLKK